jgi:hypothetical protein
VTITNKTGDIHGRNKFSTLGIRCGYGPAHHYFGSVDVMRPSVLDYVDTECREGCDPVDIRDIQLPSGTDKGEEKCMTVKS